jgi:CRP-like cAMP-binding protein
MRTLIEKLDSQQKMCCDLKLELLYQFERREISKGKILVKEGAIPNCLYFVEDGFIASAIWEDEIRKYTRFWLPGAVIYDHKHLIKQTRVTEHLYAHRDSLVFALTIDKIRDNLIKFPDFREHMRDLADAQTAEIEEHKNILRGRFPEKKYEMFLAYYGDLAREIPHEHVASFLCISESNLYRVRNNRIH